MEDLGLTEEEFRRCLAIHGYISSNEDSDSNSDSSSDTNNVDFDELYKDYKPPPIEIDPKIHRIIEIGPNYKEPTSLTTSFEANLPEVGQDVKLLNNESKNCVAEVSKSQKKRTKKWYKKKKKKKKRKNRTLQNESSANSIVTNSKMTDSLDWFDPDMENSQTYNLNKSAEFLEEVQDPKLSSNNTHFQKKEYKLEDVDNKKSNKEDNERIVTVQSEASGCSIFSNSNSHLFETPEAVKSVPKQQSLENHDSKENETLKLGGLSKSQKKRIKKKLKKSANVFKGVGDKIECKVTGGAKKKVKKQETILEENPPPQMPGTSQKDLEICPEESSSKASTSSEETQTIKSTLPRTIENDKVLVTGGAKKKVKKQETILEENPPPQMPETSQKDLEICPEGSSSKASTSSAEMQTIKSTLARTIENDKILVTGGAKKKVNKQETILEENPPPQMPDTSQKDLEICPERSSSKASTSSEETQTIKSTLARRIENDKVLVTGGAKKKVKKQETILEENPPPQMPETSQKDLEICPEGSSSKASTSSVETQTIENEVLVNNKLKNQKKKYRKPSKNESTKNEANGDGIEHFIPTTTKSVVLTQPIQTNGEIDTTELESTKEVLENSDVPSFQIVYDDEDMPKIVVSKHHKEWNPSFSARRPRARNHPKNIIAKDTFSLTRKFGESLNYLLVLLQHVPFDVVAIDETVNDIVRHLGYFGVRPLKCFYLYCNLIKTFAQTQADYMNRPGERSLRKYFDLIYILKKMCLQLRCAEDFSPSEEGVWCDFTILMKVLLDTVLTHSHTEAEKKWRNSKFFKNFWQSKINSDGPNWYLKTQRSVSVAEKIFSEIYKKSSCDAEIIEVADSKERQFFYDGSYYYQNCKSWQNFQNLYLNCDVLIPVRDQSLIQAPDEHLVIADFTTNPRILHYSGNCVEFWQNFHTLLFNREHLKRNHLKCYFVDVFVEADCHPDDTLTLSPQAWTNPEEELNRIDVSVSDEIINTLVNLTLTPSNNSHSELPLTEDLVENDNSSVLTLSNNSHSELPLTEDLVEDDNSSVLTPSDNSHSELLLTEDLVENDNSSVLTLSNDSHSVILLTEDVVENVNSLVCENNGLSVDERDSIFQATAIDYPLLYVEQFCSVNYVLLSIIFKLLLSNKCYFVVYGLEIVGSMVAFMYLCIYFVIKFSDI